MAICSGNTAMAREPPLGPGAQLLVETSFGTPALWAAAIVRRVRATGEESDGKKMS